MTGRRPDVRIGLWAGCFLLAVSFQLTVTAACSTWNTQTEPTITEDDPRWDCSTMGNRVCGPLQEGTDR